MIEFETGDALAEALAKRVADVLAQAVERDGAASLAVSGGSTPRGFFLALSKHALAWDKVAIALVDERFVPSSHERSNHRLVATLLLQNEAAFAQFVPLFADGISAAEAARRAAGNIAAIKQPFDAVILGMGTDGHTASWFPQSDQLDTVTDPATDETVMAIDAPGAGEPRLTLTLPVIARAGLCILHIEGSGKKDVLDKALQPGPVSALPIRAALKKTGSPLQIYWAP